MKIQLIIPVLNPEESFFSETLPLLRSQTIPLDILLINSGSEIAAGDYELQNIEKKDFNHADTRNIALGYEADFYLFMTQDARPCDEMLVENLLNAFEDARVVAAYARQIPYEDADAIEVFGRTTNYPEHSAVKSKKDLAVMGIKTFFSSDSCAMYRGEYFKKVGGFAPGLSTNEDMEFVARAIMDEKKAAYVAEAKVYHSHNFTPGQVWQRYVQIGRFFAKNSWILDEAAKYKAAESTGARQALNELKHLAKHSPLSIPRSIMLSAIKYVAFKVGKGAL